MALEATFDIDFDDQVETCPIGEAEEGTRDKIEPIMQKSILKNRLLNKLFVLSLTLLVIDNGL